ncbi:DUF3050 domain-containing protein [Planctomicrobium sp. SH527]|uniref:DUF3050 domain-containing protein n=1 Tax=Planctomicrobium sp. SH527 TaxID=3448123 RepID=UPI003F5BFB5D
MSSLPDTSSQLLDTSKPATTDLEPAIAELMAHPIYEEVNSLERLRSFMREHVFAVWDFMSLLKRLQREFCGTQLPWMPPTHPDLARFINDIVVAEESDIDGQGGYSSHFDLYLAAMDQIGADTQPIRSLLNGLQSQISIETVLDSLPINDETKAFVRFNLELAEHGTTGEVAAAFCYGREDIIPEMFTRLLAPLAKQNLDSERFRYYLRRHVELDGDTHGPLAHKMVAILSQKDEQAKTQSLAAGQRAIEMRILLWNGIQKQIHQMTR